MSLSIKTIIKDSAYSTLGYLARRRLDTDRLILMYHSVGSDHNLGPLDISLDAFKRQMACLKSEYVVVPMCEILDTNHEKPVVAITFDDGYSHLLPEVAELLTRESLPATFYIPVGLVGKAIATSYGESRVMDWDGLRKIASAGLAIGSHAMSHERLTTLEPSAAKSEIVESREVLEDRLGTGIEDFSYPSGKYNTEIVGYVQDAGYKRAVTVNETPMDISGDPFTLPRVGVFASTTEAQFRAKLSGAGYYYNQAKERVWM